MEQDIRFCEVEGSRVAYATLGEGPLLVFGAKWVSHLEEEWDDPRARDFFTELARSHRVVRYDRLGAGLSARELPRPPSIELDTRVLRRCIHACGDEPATMFAFSCSSVVTASLAARAPERVRKIVFFGSYVSRDDLPEATRRSIVDFVRANWALASQMLAGLIVPHASGDEIAALSRYKRHSADAELAAAFLELELVRRRAAVPPARDDARARAPSPGRSGGSHRPGARARGPAPERALRRARRRLAPAAVDDQRELQRALAGFLDDAVPVEANGDSPLTGREAEVLRLVAAGLSNREIACSLVLSEHTVHRHVANILRKLTQSSRAAAAAHATRVGYI